MSVYASFPRPTRGKNIGYNTTPADGTAVGLRIHVRATYAKPKRGGELRSVSRTLARADPVNLGPFVTCSCPKEDVDGVNQYFPCYSPFK